MTNATTDHLVLITDFQTDALKKLAEASSALNDALICIDSLDPALVTPLAEVLGLIADLSGAVSLVAAKRLREPPTTSPFDTYPCGCPVSLDNPRFGFDDHRNDDFSRRGDQ